MRTLILAAALAVGSHAFAGTPRASSEFRDDDGKRHGASFAFDGLLQTGWAEAADGAGEGEWLELRFDRPTQVESISIWPGNLERGKRSLKEYGRPSLVTVTLETSGPEEEWPTKKVRIEDGAINGPERVDIRIEGEAKKLRLQLEEVNGGIVYGHTFIAEVAVNFDRGDTPKAVEQALEYARSAAATKAQEKSDEEVKELYATIQDEETPEDDARDALKTLIERAADGASHIRSRAARYVPAGYRMSALPPDETAVDALINLRDPNGIPGVELASLRAQGKLGGSLALKAQYFYAYQDLIGGAPPLPAPFGDTGWGEGAIQSLGEAPQIEVSPFGQPLVADIGNHRVTRYTDSGTVERSWGASPEREDKTDQITNTWVGGKRRFYVAGSPPSTKPGAFTLPLDVAIVPGKDTHKFAVLDAAGRIQLFDEGGNPALEWKVQTEAPLESGVGGQAFLVWCKGSLVAVWGSEAFVYNLSSEEVGRFEIEDGAPSGAVGLKNGKLGLIVDQELVQYSLDGFRHGSMMGDTLPDGFESWDADLDEEGRLWAVTDTGWALKYKKPGKLDFKVRFTEKPLGYLRVGVYMGKVFLLHGDHIQVIDALELKRKAELAEAEGE